jgi:hypothetical protein
MGGMMRLSQLPEVDLGEAAARAAAGDTRPPAPPAPSPVEERHASPLPEPARVPSAVEPQAAPAGLSFEALWPTATERALVRELEQALVAGDFARALAGADRLVARTFASAGALLGGSQDAPRDPATVLLLLGLEGQRYLELRALVRDVRGGRAPGLLDALRAYATAIEARLLRAKIGA